jgi:hypothetical protein
MITTGRLRVGKVIQLVVTTYQRKTVGPRYKGVVLFVKMLEYNVMPERVDNFYVCPPENESSLKFVRVEDLCTLLAQVKPRTGNVNEVNLVPIAHAFPVMWIA